MSTLPIKAYLSQPAATVRKSDVKLSAPQEFTTARPQGIAPEGKTTDKVSLSKEAIARIGQSTTLAPGSALGQPVPVPVATLPETPALKPRTPAATPAATAPAAAPAQAPVNRREIFAQSYQQLDKVTTRIAEIVKQATDSNLTGAERAALKDELSRLTGSLSELGAFAAQGTTGVNTNLMKNTFSAKFNGFDKIDISSADAAASSLGAVQARQNLVSMTFNMLKNGLPA